MFVVPTAVCESLVQVIVVAGPPVEIQVRVNSSSEISVNVTPSGIVIPPTENTACTDLTGINYGSDGWSGSMHLWLP